MSKTALRPTQPPIKWVAGTVPLGVNQPRREADHSLPSNAEVKDEYSYISSPPIRPRGVLLS
jgi:hypothetical protein